MLFGYVWIRLDTKFWIRLDTFWIRILDKRTLFGYATFLDTFGYAMDKISSFQKNQNICLDTFGYANGKIKEHENAYPKVSKHFGYVQNERHAAWERFLAQP